MISPVRPGGWGPGFVPSATELAQEDARIAGGVDAVGGDTITGPLDLVQDTVHAGATAPKITGSANVYGGGVMGTGAAGSVILTGTFPTYSTPRTRTVWISPLEVTRTATSSSFPFGSSPIIDRKTGGISQAIAAPGTTFEFSLTKPMDGATISTVTAYYYVPGVPAALPTGDLILELKRTPIATNSIAIIGANEIAMGTFATPLAWYNGGAIQSIVVNGSGTIPIFDNVVDLSTYVYRVAILGPVTSSSTMLPAPIFTGIAIGYTAIPDERFTQ